MIIRINLCHESILDLRKSKLTKIKKYGKSTIKLKYFLRNRLNERGFKYREFEYTHRVLHKHIHTQKYFSPLTKLPCQHYR